jgi:hypothetical protein
LKTVFRSTTGRIDHRVCLKKAHTLFQTPQARPRATIDLTSLMRTS